jgi:hypothetical protein
MLGCMSCLVDRVAVEHFGFPCQFQFHQLSTFIDDPNIGAKGARGSIVGCTMLQAVRSRIRFRMKSLDFQLTKSFQPQYGFGVDSASNRNEYQESSWV